MRRTLIGLLSVIALTVLGPNATAGAVTAHSSAAAAGSCYFLYDNYGYGYGLTDNGHGAQVITSAYPNCWYLINGQRWTIPYNGHVVNVYELQSDPAVGGGGCLNVGSNRVVYIDTCHRGDWNELFWHTGPLGHEWYINVAQSEAYICQSDLYANHISSGSSVSISICNTTPSANDMWKSNPL
jgi:hypothetical protein